MTQIAGVSGLGAWLDSSESSWATSWHAHDKGVATRSHAHDKGEVRVSVAATYWWCKIDLLPHPTPQHKGHTVMVACHPRFLYQLFSTINRVS